MEEFFWVSQKTPFIHRRPILPFRNDNPEMSLFRVTYRSNELDCTLQRYKSEFSLQRILTTCNIYNMYYIKFVTQEDIDYSTLLVVMPRTHNTKTSFSFSSFLLFAHKCEQNEIYNWLGRAPAISNCLKSFNRNFVWSSFVILYRNSNETQINVCQD